MTTTSAKDGSFSFAKVPYGKWIVREIEQPKGFVLDEKAYEVNISKAEQVVEIEIVNEYVHGNIRLTKVDAEYPDNKLIDNLNFNYLLGFADIDLIRFFIKNKSLWLLDFSYNPFAIRNFCKRKTTVFCRGSRHKCSILCKFCFLSL